MTAPDERAALAAHREACGVCGHDGLCWQALEMIEATHARRLEESMRAEAELNDQLALTHGRLEEARAALDDMTGLAAGLDDDDPWFGERRNAAERIKAAEAVLARLAPPPPRREA